jgi:hypothetical protein
VEALEDRWAPAAIHPLPVLHPAAPALTAPPANPLPALVSFQPVVVYVPPIPIQIIRANQFFVTSTTSPSAALSANVAQLAAVGASVPSRLERTTSFYPEEEDGSDSRRIREVVDKASMILDLGAFDFVPPAPALNHLIDATRPRLPEPQAPVSPDGLSETPNLLESAPSRLENRGEFQPDDRQSPDDLESRGAF